MSLFNTLNTGATGLSVNSTNLSVIGDNIANINTVGFKGGRARFADMMPTGITGLGGSNQVGMGAQVGGVATSFGQGSIENTGSVLDMAISGNGFFALSTGENTYYTRDGTFYMDADGYIVSAGGLRLQGYQASGGDLTTIVGDLQIDQSPTAGQATSQMTVDANLSAETTYLDEDGNPDTPLDDLDLAGGGVSIEDAAAAADYATSMTIYDSLGVAHEVTVLFERTDEGTWSWQAVVDEGELSGAGPDDTGNAFVISSGEMEFDTDGNLISSTDNPTATAWNFEAAGDQTVDFLFGADSSGDSTDGKITMTGSESSVTTLTQDGYTQGELTSLSIDSEGVITGVYTNGENMVLGQVALATFSSEAGLDRVGGNLFHSGRDAGAPTLGVPDSGGRGTVNAYALEKANVNLEDEFVYMIEAQRAYQSNARVITTANETLQELVNLV
jgi:flagellar hook protein FlgE